MSSTMYYHATLLARRIKMPDLMVGADFRFRSVSNGVALVCVVHTTRDNFTGAFTSQSGKWWAITDDMSDQVVLNTMYQAFETFLLHELREQWRVDDKAIYMPKH